VTDSVTRWAWADIDLDAVRHNVGVLRATVAPSEVWVVVKANGYGHGAVAVSRAAVEAGATGLCVALAGEGIELRRAGVEVPILVLSEQPADTAGALVRNDLTATVYSEGAVAALADAAAGRSGVAVHVKIDTGMQRVGAHPDHAAAVVRAVLDRAPTLRLAGVFTHLAIADEPRDEFTAIQLQRFDEVLDRLRLDPGLPDDVIIHAANSAGALAHPAARRSLVRAGIAVYGVSPGHGVDDLCDELRPALSLRARVSFVKPVAAGSRISYGLRHTFERDTIVATVPIGYADGVPRRLSATGGEVLIGGRRCPIVGVVTMDQLMVDCGPADSDRDAVRHGDEVVLIGSQEGPAGRQCITAEDWADRLGTIAYEIVCGIGTRVPRRAGPSIEQ
jgi:alanine racemase